MTITESRLPEPEAGGALPSDRDAQAAALLSAVIAESQVEWRRWQAAQQRYLARHRELVALEAEHSRRYPDGHRKTALCRRRDELREAVAAAAPSNAPAAPERASGRAVLKADRALQAAVVIEAVDHQIARSRAPRGLDWERTYRQSVDVSEIARALCRRKQPYTEADVCRLLALMSSAPHLSWGSYDFGPEAVLRTIKLWIADHGLSPAVESGLLALLRSPGVHHSSEQLDKHLQDALNGGRQPERPIVYAEDDWGDAVIAGLERLSHEEQVRWLTLLAFCMNASGAQPSPGVRTASAGLVQDIGERAFVEQMIEWLAILCHWPRESDRLPEYPTLFRPSFFRREENAAVMKGLAWCCAGIEDAELARALADLVELAFKKVSGVLPRSVKVANACVYALGAMPGTHGVLQLSRLAQRVRHKTAGRAIEDARQLAALRLDIDPDDLDDCVVPTFDLDHGRARMDVGRYSAEIVISGVSRVELRWQHLDGRPLRRQPAAVTRTNPDEVRKLKTRLSDVRTMLAVQRDRLEGSLLDERAWRFVDWRTRLLAHPLLSLLVRRLIWSFGPEDQAISGTWLDGRLVNLDDWPLGSFDDQTPVRLWHPLDSQPRAVDAWREWLERHQVTQPFKQAHREVYLLTAAELDTATYSNRFAGHLLRQHQFKALCDARGWRYTLGTGRDGWTAATKELPGGLRAEFMVEASATTEDEVSPAGIALYAATDRVQFTAWGAPGGWGTPVPLRRVTAVEFTEVMRDVDLFVGVSSVGNDPAWYDRGPEPHRVYWQRYAFGELSVTAAIRRAVLERLLPRLTIAERSSLEERFLVVRGDLQTYRIHLGSGNILMEPGSRYLCIVPRRGPHIDASSIRLPFEGDSMLSVILSKAFLLAKDTAITDPTITRQLALR